MNKFWWFLFLIIFIGGFLWLIFFNERKETSQLASMFKDSKKTNIDNVSIREPITAGQFYPSNKEELIKTINQFLNQVELPEIDGEIKMLIAPHAGYDFSGQTAAYAFKAVQGQDIDKVILIGSSHQEYLQGAIIDGNDSWKTPIGNVNLDNDLRDLLIKDSELFKIDSVPHELEYSLEVEVPFLQTVLKDFKLLPILISHELKENELEEISNVLSEYIDEKTLIVASSDMSHYPDYEKANYADKKVADAILSGQFSIFQEVIKQIKEENILNLSTCLCSQSAVDVVMKLTEKIGVDSVKLLKYVNSGDIEIGDKSRVVGYGSFIFTKKPENYLNQEQKNKLLEIARTSVEKYVLEGKLADFNTEDELLNKKLGAFVTLKKNSQLRGCIGSFEPNIPLYQVVSQMAVSAAVKDKRFNPVNQDELNDLEYEISVLSSLKKIDNWKEIEIGKHGVQIKKGSSSGVFLPQVATENNWNLNKFMGELCSQKAGLEKDCWKTGEVDMYVFTVKIIK